MRRRADTRLGATSEKSESRPASSHRSLSTFPGIPGTMRDMSDAQTRILVVDDEQSITDLVAMALKYEGFTVQTAATARAARQAVLDFRPALIILDVGLPDQDGFTFTQKLIGDGLKVP